MKKRIWLYRIIFLAALAVFIYAAVNLGMILWDYQKGSGEYKGLKEFTSEDPAEDVDEEVPQEETFFVDFDKLKAENPDCIAWIRFENIDISYPVMQGKDNEYYLKHTFYGEQRTAGSIFMEYQNNPEFEDNNTFVYGHNMKDGTMFAKLNRFKDKDFYQENPGFWIYTPEYTYRYDIFSCYVTGLEADIFNCSFADEKDFEDWIKNAIGSSNYDTEIVPKSTDKIVTLMTCTPAGDAYRFLVHGVQSSKTPVK